MPIPLIFYLNAGPRDVPCLPGPLTSWIPRAGERSPRSGGPPAPRGARARTTPLRPHRPLPSALVFIWKHPPLPLPFSAPTSLSAVNETRPQAWRCGAERTTGQAVSGLAGWAATPGEARGRWARERAVSWARSVLPAVPHPQVVAGVSGRPAGVLRETGRGRAAGPAASRV